MKTWNKTLKRQNRYYQGFINSNQFKNPKKFKNPDGIMTYRSSYERKFAFYCDENPEILEWSSEILWIPYFFECKVKRYFPDFFIKIKDTFYVIEIKPSFKLKPPKSKSLKQLREYNMNQSKFSAAENFCKEKGYIFKIITEHDLT